MKWIIRIAMATVPLGIAVSLDCDLSNRAHAIVLGAVAICVTLSDALFGQVITNTKWSPFCACHTPQEAEVLVVSFQKYHSRLFRLWMLAKICGMITIIIPALQAAGLLVDCNAVVRWIILGGGYALLGVAFVVTIGFVTTYTRAIAASDGVKLKEMNCAFKREHPEYFKPDRGMLARQLEGFGREYTSQPKTAEDVK